MVATNSAVGLLTKSESNVGFALALALRQQFVRMRAMVGLQAILGIRSPFGEFVGGQMAMGFRRQRGPPPLSGELSSLLVVCFDLHPP